MYRVLFILISTLTVILYWADPHVHTHLTVCALRDSPNRMYAWSDPKLTRAESTLKWNEETPNALKWFYTLVYMPRATYRVAIAWGRLWWLFANKLYYKDAIGLDRSLLDDAIKATTAAYFFAYEDTLTKQKCPNQQKFIHEMQDYLYDK